MRLLPGPSGLFKRLASAGSLCLAAVSLLSASSGAVRTVAHYDVTCKGFRIGDVTSTQQVTGGDGAAVVSFETKTNVKASFLWMGYRQATIEKGTIRDGSLVGYSRQGEENGVRIDVRGHLDETAFRFEVTEGGATRTVTIPRQSYDHTTMECPEALLDFSGKRQIVLRVLDVEQMMVVKRKYSFIRDAHYTVSGREYPCRIIDFEDQNKNVRRWINREGPSIVLYRQDGRGGREYSVQASSLTKEM